MTPNFHRYFAADGAHIKLENDVVLQIPDLDYNWLETSLFQTSIPTPEMKSFRGHIGGISEIYHSLNVARKSAVRMPQIISPAQMPGTDGEDLLSCLHTMRETDRDRFVALEDALRAAFPNFQRLEFPAYPGGYLTLGWRDKNFTRPIYANELSEGTLRFLWLVTLLNSPGLPSVTLIDEPEVSLHPEMLQLMADLMREASQRTQLVVATHSDRFIRFLNPDELIVCDQDEQGGMTTKRADELDLAAWMEDYTLDQLWSMGPLGGRS